VKVKAALTRIAAALERISPPRRRLLG